MSFAFRLTAMILSTIPNYITLKVQIAMIHFKDTPVQEHIIMVFGRAYFWPNISNYVKRRAKHNSEILVSTLSLL